MSFAQDLRNKVFAGALSIGLAFGAAAPSFAQDTNANENIQKTSLQAQDEVITSAEALERSSGKIVLHYGEGYSQFDLESLERRIEALDIEVELYAGGIDNSIEFYFYKNKIPKVFTFDNSTEIVYLAENFAERYNLGKYHLAQNDMN